jgi:hypothetical protein
MAVNLSGVLLRLASVVVHPDASKIMSRVQASFASSNLCILFLTRSVM